MTNREPSSLNKFEMRVYRFLGIKQFQKVILWVEKKKHCTDKRRIENYHPSDSNVLSFERYNGFLLYNASLHCVSMLFVILFFILSAVFEFQYMLLNTLMIILTLLNFYCIILQRNSYLRIREYCYKYYKRIAEQNNRCLEEAKRRIRTHEPQALQAEYKLICKMRDAFLGKKDCFLYVSDVEDMKHIYECIEPILLEKPHHTKSQCAEVGLIDNCTLFSGPYTALQLRADWLQRKSGLTGLKMLSHTAIITEDSECEAIYKKLVPEDTAYTLYFICGLLYEEFTDVVVRVNANET